MNSYRKSERIPELDGLRGVAIGTILFFHYVFLPATPTPGTLPSYLLVPGRIGWSGVDLFFVLSGFLIGGILLDAKTSTNFYSVFYARRFFRILPAYMMMLALFLGFLALQSLTATHYLSLVTSNSLPVAPYFLFLQNLWMAARNTFGGTTLGITWSLAIEEQFYLTLPWIIRRLPTTTLPAFLIGGTAFAVALRLVLVLAIPTNAISALVLMPCRADALLLGVLAAYAFRHPDYLAWIERSRALLRNILAVFAVGTIAIVLLLPRVGFRFMPLGGYTWFAAFFVCCLVYALITPQSLLSKFLRWRWLRFLGIVAYGTYLCHEFILNLVFAAFRSKSPQLASSNDLILTTLALITTLACCAVSWHFFEKPLVRFGHRWQHSGDPAAIPGIPSVNAADPATP